MRFGWIGGVPCYAAPPATCRRSIGRLHLCGKLRLKDQVNTAQRSCPETGHPLVIAQMNYAANC